jgi:glycosyltransferase involved in cell wall biosynthesis
VNSDLVSVIVPTFNRAYCLVETLNSVFNQTHRNIELLLVDDGSTDDTREMVERHFAHEPRLHYIYQVNRGVSAARNLGLRKASGAYVALLDSDDVWMPWKLSAQLACLAAFSEAGMIWTDMRAVDAEGRLLNPMYLRTMYSAYRWFTPEQLYDKTCPMSEIMIPIPDAISTAVARSGDIFSPMLMGNLVHTSTVLLRRSRLEQVRGFDESMRTGEDYAFHLRTCQVGPVAFLDAASISYQCGRADQLSRNDLMIEIARNFMRTVEPAIRNNRERITLPDWMITQSLTDGHRWLGETALEAGEHLEALRHLTISLRLDPWQARTAALLASALLPPAVSLTLRKGLRPIRRALLAKRARVLPS